MTADRLAAFGNQLIEVHDWLRDELAQLRDNLDDDRPRDLRAHCLMFCRAIRRHHTGEDGEAFPVLAQEFPELRPVLDELERDHRQVAEILERIESESDLTRAELDGLAALLESHFGYEEKKIVAALNSVRVPWSEPEFLRRDGD